MNNSISIQIKETYQDYQHERYLLYLKTLGSNIEFDDNKWVCDNAKRNFTENNYYVTVYFTKVRQEYKAMVKYFAIIRLLNGVSIRMVKNNIFYISEFLNFVDGNLQGIDYNTAVRYKAYLDHCDYVESTKNSKWSSINMFFEIMSGYAGYEFKMYFAENPYISHKKCDYKYIPKDILNKLDRHFYSDEMDEAVRCIYWILRLIPSRISEVLNIKIDCLKPFDKHYCLFIPTWKQNGGRKEPIMRIIHIEEDNGMGSYLLKLIRKRQLDAEYMQKYMPDNKKGALFTYQRKIYRKNGDINKTNVYSVMTWVGISHRFKAICDRYDIHDENNQIYNLTSHQFRHNGITDRLESGFTVEQISDMTGHHGSTMIFDSYDHLNLKPEVIRNVQNAVIGETETGLQISRFNGKITNLDEALEKELMKNVRAHKVRGGICSDITGCKSDMLNCLECKCFIPDPEQIEFYKEQIQLWKQKSERFKAIPIIKENAEKNILLFEKIVNKLSDF